MEIMQEFLEYEKPRVSAQGYTWIRGHVRRMMEWFEAQGLDPLKVEIPQALRYQAWVGEKISSGGQVVSPGTMQNYIKAARRFYDYLVITERIKSNTFRELVYPRMNVHLSRNVLSEAQMGRLLRELGNFDNLRTYRVHVIAELLYATGLRIAEASSLACEDLDLSHRQIYLKNGKGDKPRTVFLTSYACEILSLYIKEGREMVLGTYYREHGQTLLGADKHRVAAVVNAELKTQCIRLEIPVITTHGFRHSLGTHLLRSGCDMRHIQGILGHEALGTTQIYTRVDKDDLKKSLDEYHPRQCKPRGELV